MARMLRPCDEAFNLLGNLVVQGHIWPWIDESFHHMAGLHHWFSAMENEDVHLYGAVDNDMQPLGCIVFEWVSQEECAAHLFFYRDADALGAAFAIEKAIKQDFPALKRIIGLIPDACRAARILAFAYGSKDEGECNISCVRNGKVSKVHKFVKYLEV